MKINTVNFDGIDIPIEDPNGIKTPSGSPQDGDILVYNAETSKFEFRSQNAVLEIDDIPTEDSRNAVSSGGVKAALTALENSIKENKVYINAVYNNETKRLAFTVTNGNLLSPIQIVLMSLNISCDLTQDEFSCAKLFTILNIPAGGYSAYVDIPDYEEARTINYFIINNYQKSQTCILQTSSVVIPAVGGKINNTISVVLDTIGPAQVNAHRLLFTASENVDTDVTFRVVIPDQYDDELILTCTMQAGTSYAQTNTFARSSVVRTAYIEMNYDPDTIYNYITNSSISIPSTLTLIPLVAVASNNSPEVYIKLRDNYQVLSDIKNVEQDINIILSFVNRNNQNVEISGVIPAGTDLINTPILCTLSYDNNTISSYPYVTIDVGNTYTDRTKEFEFDDTGVILNYVSVWDIIDVQNVINGSGTSGSLSFRIQNSSDLPKSNIVVKAIFPKNNSTEEILTATLSKTGNITYIFLSDLSSPRSEYTGVINFEFENYDSFPQIIKDELKGVKYRFTNYSLNF